MKLKWLYQERKYLLNRQREAFIRKIAWMLPRELVKWTYIRVVLNATNGEYQNQVVPDLTAMDALNRWEPSKHG